MTERCDNTGKVCYSRREAGTALARCRHSRVKGKIPKRIYYCKECGWYHLTSQLKNKKHKAAEKAVFFIKEN